jgi:hypothetical protein
MSNLKDRRTSRPDVGRFSGTTVRLSRLGITVAILLGLAGDPLFAQAVPPAPAHDFPNLNVGPTCRSASDRQKCMEDEQTARGQLAKEWGQFAGGDKTSCTQTVSDIAGSQSYVELLTCLEMARDAKKLPKE